MDQAETYNQQQDEFWNGAMGQTWVETQEITDEMLAPAAEVVVAEARRVAPRTVLDIGCGNGTTTRAIADALPNARKVVGIDISQTMIEHAQNQAKERGSAASFLAADAAAYPYPAGHYDLIVSRFGSMFFGDQIAALRHLRKATASGGRLCFVVWQKPDANAFLMEGAKAAAELLPDVPPRPEEAPSPFAMADEAKMTERLAASGWSDPAFEPLQLKFGFPVKHLEVFMRKLAPIGPGLEQMEEAAREAVFDRVREAYASYVTNDRLEYDAACLVIRASAAA